VSEQKVCPIMSRFVYSAPGSSQFCKAMCIREKCEAWVSRISGLYHKYHHHDCPAMVSGSRQDCTCDQKGDFGYCKMMGAGEGASKS